MVQQSQSQRLLLLLKLEGRPGGSPALLLRTLYLQHIVKSHHLMAFCNRYKPSTAQPQDYHLDTDAAEYDLNCSLCEEIPARLETPGVILVPFVPSLHAKHLYARLQRFPEVYRYLPYGPFPGLTSYLTFVEVAIRRDAASLPFVIFDQSLTFEDTVDNDDVRPERIAGFIGLLQSQPAHRKTEIGHITILPPFQRSHVTTHACVALARWTLDDLKLRRLQWQASVLNEPSVNVALRLGMTREGTLRWDRVLPVHSEGVDLPAWAAKDEEDAGRGKGRHTAMLSMTWDDWHDGGGRQKCLALLERPVKKRAIP